MGAAGAPTRRYEPGGDLRAPGDQRSAGGAAMNVLAIFKREFRAYFAPPIAYVVLTIFALISGYFFYSLFTFFSLSSLQATMNPDRKSTRLNSSHHSISYA